MFDRGPKEEDIRHGRFLPHDPPIFFLVCERFYVGKFVSSSVSGITSVVRRAIGLRELNVHRPRNQLVLQRSQGEDDRLIMRWPAHFPFPHVFIRCRRCFVDGADYPLRGSELFDRFK